MSRAREPSVTTSSRFFIAIGVTEVIGREPFFGGRAADNTLAGDWMIYNGAEAFADGCVVAFFYTDTPFANKFTGAYAETDDFGVVTDATWPSALYAVVVVSAVPPTGVMVYVSCRPQLS